MATSRLRAGVKKTVDGAFAHSAERSPQSAVGESLADERRVRGQDQSAEDLVELVEIPEILRAALAPGIAVGEESAPDE